MRKLLVLVSALCITLGVFGAKALDATAEEQVKVITDQTAESGFVYSLNQSNQITITGYTGGEERLEIPAVIDEYEVVAIGEKAFKGNTNLVSVVIPDSVTTINKYAFQNCSSLVEVTFPKTLETIGGLAFADCDLLTSIELPKTLNSCPYYYSAVGAFNGCDNLRKVVFEEGSTVVPAYLFYGCVGLEEVVLPKTVTTIGYQAFAYCSNLKNVEWEYGVTQIGEEAFLNCSSLEEIVIPDSVTSIGNFAFKNCTALADLTLSASLETLGASAFAECDALTEVTIPKKVSSCPYKYSSEGAFRNCSSLKTVTFEEGSTVVPSYLFYGAPSLEKVVIPGTVTTIGYQAFANCTSLKNIEWAYGTTQIGEEAFINCSGLKEIVIPDSVTKIGNYAFSNCVRLENLVLSKNLVYIGASAFSDCDALIEVEIPKTVSECPYKYNAEGAFRGCDKLKIAIFEEGSTNVAANLFFNCYGLEEVILPESMQTISYYAFRYCSKLKSIDLSKGVLWVGERAFENTGITEVKLSENATKLYKHAFYNCDELVKVELPDTMETLDEYSFADCRELKEVDLGEGVTTIGKYAFNNCDSLTAIAIPDSVTSLGAYSFAGCEMLGDIQLGCGLTQITNNVFESCAAAQKIILPYSVKTVGNSAFAYGTSLTELVIPRGTTSIASNAFTYPTKMTVYGVTGTYAEEWANSVGATFVNHEVPATELAISDTELTLNRWATATLALKLAPIDCTDEIIWKSNNEKVATVSEDGVVTAVAVGEATIYVNVGSLKASCKVTVTQKATAISLNKTVLSLRGMDTYQLKATVLPTDASDKTVTWSSSDETVATVNAEGVVTGVRKGSAVITATANDGSGASNSCTVTVTCTYITCDTVEELESAHNYENDSNSYWYYCVPGASELIVTFDERTELEDGFDYLYLYSAAGTELGKFTGTALAGQTITVAGNGIEIRLVSDKGGNAWGFKVISVEDPDGAAKKQVNAFVERMYTVALGRDAEAEGCTWWANALINGESDGAGLAYGFLLGDEFKNKGYSNEEYVAVLYDTFFNREIAEGEGDFWVAGLNSGTSRESVLSGFVNSEEFFNLCASYGISRGVMREDGSIINSGIGKFAERLYTEVLGRAGEESGMEYWATAIANGDCEPKDAAMNFFQSDEYLSKNSSDEEYVKALYRTFMDRDCDEDGLEYWVNTLSSGTTRESVLAGFAASEEFQIIMANYGL